MARPKKPAEVPIIPPWFKVWTDWHDSIAMLTNEQAGELLKAMVSFSIDGIEPKFNDNLLKAYWSFIATQMRLDRQKYINQVKSNREAGRISAKNKAEKTKKKLYQKSGVFEAENTDGTTDNEQVLTSVNEGKKERRKKEEPKEPKEKKRIEVTDSLDKTTTTDFDVDGYNMANDLWFRYNGRQSLSPQEKSYLRKCVAEHGAEFICGCIGILKTQKKIISTTTLPAVIEEEKTKAEAEAEKRAPLDKAIAEADKHFQDAGIKFFKDHLRFQKGERWKESDASYSVLELLQDDDDKTIYHTELLPTVLQDIVQKYGLPDNRMSAGKLNDYQFLDKVKDGLKKELDKS